MRANVPVPPIWIWSFSSTCHVARLLLPSGSRSGAAIFASFTILPSTNSDTEVVFLLVQSMVAAMCFHVLPGTTTPHPMHPRPRDASVNIFPVVVMNTTYPFSRPKLHMRSCSVPRVISGYTSPAHPAPAMYPVRPSRFTHISTVKKRRWGSGWK